MNTKEEKRKSTKGEEGEVLSLSVQIPLSWPTFNFRMRLNVKKNYLTIYVHEIIITSISRSENDTVIQLIRDAITETRKNNERPNAQSACEYINKKSH